MNRVVKTLFGILLLGAALGLSTAAPAPKKSTKAAVSSKTRSRTSSPAVRAKSSTASRSRTSSKRATSSKRTTPSKRRVTSKRRTRRSSRHYTRVGQQKPMPERITEIEAALIRHGFLTGEADGVWDGTSIEALKRFQERHDIRPTGKLSSLSLIALGLGPQRAPFQNATLPATVNPAPQPVATDGEGSPRDE